jgi:ankyrin repeat protein
MTGWNMNINEIVSQLMQLINRLVPLESPIHTFDEQELTEFLMAYIASLARENELHLKRMESETYHQALQTQDTNDYAQAHFTYFMNKLEDASRYVLIPRSELESAAKFLTEILTALQNPDTARAYAAIVPGDLPLFIICAQAVMLSADFSDNYREKYSVILLEDTAHFYHYALAVEYFEDFPDITTDQWLASAHFLIQQTLLKMPEFISVKDEPEPEMPQVAIKPLHLAIANGNLTECAKLLSDSPPEKLTELLEEKNAHGYNAIQIAVQHDSLATAVYLNSLDSNIVKVEDEGGRSLLSLAIVSNASTITSYLDCFQNLDLKRPCKKGWTPLHYAAYFCHKLCVQALIEAGVDLNTKDHKGKTPLDYAIVREATCSKNNYFIPELLYYHGAQLGEPISRRYDNPYYEELKTLKDDVLKERALMGVDRIAARNQSNLKVV